MAQMTFNLQPASVWKHFMDLTKIPRPSGHEQKIIDHIMKFADSLGLETIKDKAGNLIVRKSAAAGMEKVDGIILQAHVDMVPQKNSDKKHDFLKDPIETIVDGEWLKANQTTLGADNGIGVASILAILEDSTITHGPLEALFTVNEETGMDGAFGLEGANLKGKVMLNLDSEEEGELYIGCAGGIDINCSWNYDTGACHGNALKITLSGLKGGHSGIDINLGRANANRVLAEILKQLSEDIPLKLESFSGGNLRNAIPREAEAIVVADDQDADKLNKLLSEILSSLKSRYKGIEDAISLKSEPVSSSGKCMNREAFETFIYRLLNCPNGVIKMSESIEDIVQTSNNISVVVAGEGHAEVKTLLRSSDNAEKLANAEKIKIIFKGAHFEAINGYPGWLPNPDSKILRLAKRVYHNTFGKEPEVKVIHAGLECGIIGDKMSGLDMLSFGPTIKHPHSPDEKVKIDTVDKFWTFLKKLVEGYQ